MNSPEQTPDPTSLHFDTSEPATENLNSDTLSCISCKQPITTEYYTLSNQVVCGECRALVQEPPPGNQAVLFAKATLGGLLAGLGGTILWYGIRKGTGLEIGLIAILVGLMVGKTIHRLADRGGIAYQLLAVAITYSCICATYVPDVVAAVMRGIERRQADELQNDQQSNVARNDESPDASPSQEEGDESNDGSLPQADGVPANEKTEPTSSPLLSILWLTKFVFSMPIRIGMRSPIHFLIYGFALWEAWKFTAHRPLPITGPYQVSASVPPKLSQA